MIAVVALALVGAACGDDDATTTTTSAATDDTTVITAAPPTTAPALATTGGIESGPDVDELLALYEITPLRATYLFGEGDNQTEVILAQDPTAVPPVESITIVEANSKIIISEGVTIFCDGSSNICFEVPGATGENLAAGLLGPAGSVFLAAGSGAFAGVDVTEEPITVAGRDGVCFTYAPPAGFAGDTDLLRQCIDSELGFTLLMQTSDTTTDVVETVMELIDFSLPSAADFEPTGPVTEQP
jgi:hypothetical protein